MTTAPDQRSDTKPSQLGEIQRMTYYFEDAGKDMEYALFLPSGYKQDKKTPLVVLLHGINTTPHQIIRYPGITSEAERRGYIVVAPFGYDDMSWYGSLEDLPVKRPTALQRRNRLSEEDLLNVLNIVCEKFNIDRRRIYLAGYSMGGSGAISMGNRYSDIWAGVAAMSPGAVALTAFSFPAVKGQATPTLIVYGSADVITSAAAIRSWVDKARRAGMNIDCIELPGATHVWPMHRPKTIAVIFDFLSNQERSAPARLKRPFVEAFLAPSPGIFSSLTDIARRATYVFRQPAASFVPVAFVLLNTLSFLDSRLIAWGVAGFTYIVGPDAELAAWSNFYKIKSRLHLARKRCREFAFGGSQTD